MHGSGATAADQETFSGMDATADQNAFIVAYPQGLIPDGSGFDWNVPGVPLVGGRAVPSGAADDVSFLTQLVGALEARYCIDTSEVYATGFSGGARITSQLACDASTTFAAVAPVSGLRRPTPCPATRPVPVIAFHGTSDPVDPYDGNGEAYWTYSVPEAAGYWGEQDQCCGDPDHHRRPGLHPDRVPGLRRRGERRALQRHRGGPRVAGRAHGVPRAEQRARAAVRRGRRRRPDVGVLRGAPPLLRRAAHSVGPPIQPRRRKR